VYKSRTGIAADAGEAAAVGEQGIDQSAAEIGIGGVDDHARSLVDYQQVFVLEDDLQGDLFGLDISGSGGGKGNNDGFARAHQVAGLGGLAVHKDSALVDQAFELCTRDRGQTGSQVEV